MLARHRPSPWPPSLLTISCCIICFWPGLALKEVLPFLPAKTCDIGRAARHSRCARSLQTVCGNLHAAAIEGLRRAKEARGGAGVSSTCTLVRLLLEAEKATGRALRRVAVVGWALVASAASGWPGQRSSGGAAAASHLADTSLPASMLEAATCLLCSIVRGGPQDGGFAAGWGGVGTMQFKLCVGDARVDLVWGCPGPRGA
jgi:hypothetical protein